MDAAITAKDRDLRAHVVADVGAQHNLLGYPSDALQIVRFGEVDERVGPHVRMVLSGVKARAYAAQGDAVACRHHIALAEQAAAAAGEATAWLGTIAAPAQLAATTGHALATLARRIDSAPLRTEARRRLATAVDGLGAGRARARAVCLAQLATVHLEAAEPDPGIALARQALEVAASIRSVRLAEHLSMVRTVAAAHPAATDDEAAIKELIADIDTTVTT